MVTIAIPGYLLYSSRSINVGWSLASPLNLLPTIVGALFIGVGLLLFYKTVSLFVRVGQGTLAPWDPTQKLVAQGIYRHVRNPMISGVLSILLGEVLVFGSAALVNWFMIFLVVNLIYIPLLEEPGLEERFGASYREYKMNVPRWIPRISPWEAE